MVIVDECHRGGANDESSWREILDHFKPAVHLGLTATPKRDENTDTYEYFGKPVYEYSLKEGIEDGFLTPYKVNRIESDIDEYQYTPDDDVLEGEVEEGKVYTEAKFNKEIFIEERERRRVVEMLSSINPNEKTIVFCANQNHALKNKSRLTNARLLPPLQTMESLLFELLWVGEILLTLAILSGFYFLEDMFAQHLVHKTVFALSAWFIYALLLWGRHQMGWRGTKAIRWALAGFVCLMLAYFGSKLVLEIILNRV